MSQIKVARYSGVKYEFVDGYAPCAGAGGGV